MPRLQFKSFATTDQVREFPYGSGRVVHLDDTIVGLGRWEPGWRWSTHLAPIMGTTSCMVHHLGYAISGRLGVVMDDGQTVEIPPDSAYEIPAGHDAWVVGDEPFVTVDWTSADVVGVGSPEPGERVLATILFTDIVDSTATLERVGDQAWRGLLAEHNRRMRGQFNRFRGREVDTTGDGFLAVFDSASRAVQCGLAMIDAAHAVGLSIRVGVHTGEVEFVGRRCARRRGAHGGAGHVPRGDRRGPRLVHDPRPARRVGAAARGRRRARPQGPVGRSSALPRRPTRGAGGLNRRRPPASVCRRVTRWNGEQP